MQELDVFKKMAEIAAEPQFTLVFGEDNERAALLARHKAWLQSIRRERPNPAHRFKIGVYIRYYNQTKYENYLYHHKKQFADTIGLCPNWELVDFYIDEGATAPNMESAPGWSRLLQDCMDGKVDLIITQKVSNVSRKMYEVTFVARMLAAQKHPIGIYFVSEDMYTLASYYQDDLKDTVVLPTPEWQCLPDEGILEALPNGL